MLEALAPEGVSLLLEQHRPGLLDGWCEKLLSQPLPRHSLWSEPARRLERIGGLAGWVPDHFPLFFFNERVLEETAAALSARRGQVRTETADRDRAAALLAELDIMHLGERSPYTLSQGETKLVWFLVQYAKAPRWLLLDHLPSGLSPAWQEKLIGFIRNRIMAADTPPVSWVLGALPGEEWYEPLLAAGNWRRITWESAQKILGDPG